MKICVVSGIFHPEIGGPATHLYELCKALSSRGHSITVITQGDIKEKQKEDYPFLVKRISRNQPIALRLIKFTLQVIKIGRRCDVFYIDHYGLPAAIANIFLRKPVVIRVASDFAWEFASRHNLTTDSILEFQRKKYPLKIGFVKAIQLFYIKRADLVIVPSEYIKNMALGWGAAKEKVRVIRNAISEEFGTDISKETARKNLNLEGKIIATIARLIPLKGINRLIEVIKELDSDARLLVVGDGPEEDRLKQLTKRLNVEERVIFKRRIPRDEIPEYLRASDIFVLNSETEGSPQVILEAMAIGVPIIATMAGGIPEIIEDGKDGLLIEPGNSSQLKSAVLKLLADEELRAHMAGNAGEKIKSFSFNEMVNEVSGLLQYLVIKKKRRNISRWKSRLKEVFASILFYSGALRLIQALIDIISKKERIVILAYHRVTGKSDFIANGMGGRNVSPKNFEKHLRYLKKNYSLISLDDFIEYAKRQNGLPKRSAIITFDDGYKDNYTDAFPVLRRYKVAATVFLAVDFIGAGKLMRPHRLYYPEDMPGPDEEARVASEIYLSWGDVEEMSRAGVSFGSHTSTHRLLSELSGEEARDEISASKDRIEKVLKRPVLHFAYPFGESGSFTEDIKDAVRESGFLSASSRLDGVNGACADPYALRRIGVGDCGLPLFASKLALNEISAVFRRRRHNG